MFLYITHAEDSCRPKCPFRTKLEAIFLFFGCLEITRLKVNNTLARHLRVSQLECVKSTGLFFPRIDCEQSLSLAVLRPDPSPVHTSRVGTLGTSYYFLQCVRRTVSSNIYYAARFFSRNERFNLLHANNCGEAIKRRKILQ